MIDKSHLIQCENSFARAFARVEERDYGLLFYSPGNPQSHDSNHALILDFGCDLDVAIDDLCRFYAGLGVRPRVYQGFVPDELEVLVPKLAARGFQVLRSDDWFFVLVSSSAIEPVPGLEVYRARELDQGIAAIVRAENNGEGDWTLGVLERQLIRDRFHLLVGYSGGTAVTMASLQLMDGLSRVDDVVTHPDHRRQGYGRALIHSLTGYHRRVSSNTLYLYASDPTAVRIYREAGFSEMDWEFDRWSAWLPWGRDGGKETEAT